jgi:hypothetical protein
VHEALSDHPEPAADHQRQIRTSALGKELSLLTSRHRQELHIADEAVLLWDIVVCLVAALLDETDKRPWTDRAESALENVLGPTFLSGEAITAKIEPALNYLVEHGETAIADWTKRIQQVGWQQFLERLLGAATYVRLVRAFRTDLAVISLGLRRASRAIMPFIVAFEDVTAPLSDEQKAAMSQLAPSGFMSLVVSLDSALEKAIVHALPAQLFAVRPDEAQALSLETIHDSLTTLRDVVSGRSRTVLADISSQLSRKVQGAKDAMSYSADGVSQAANSLVELIDRLLRQAFAEADVATWSNRHFPGDARMFHNNRPTARAKALCFVYAGLDVPEPPSVFHELVASGVVATRRQLEKLKHADLGTDEERDLLTAYLSSVEGFLTLVVGLSWAAAPDEKLETLRVRLGPAKTS